MNPPVITTVGAPDPNATPTTVTELFALLNTVIMSVIQGSYIPYILSSTTPGPDDNDKAWIVLDSSGRPLEMRTFYNGNWRRIYSGIPGEVRWYIGNPTIDFDGTGLGILGGNWDGWALMNGQNGTADYSNRFVASGDMSNQGGSGYVSGWRTFVDTVGEKAGGGAATVTLGPATTYRPATNQFTLMDKYSATGNANDILGELWGVNSAQHVQVPVAPSDPGNLIPTPINIINPFVVMALVQFVGYA